jgi:hypothetical protein
VNADLQTWIALGIVALATIYLVVRAWRRRDAHEGCDCPGAVTNRDLAKLKKRLR